MHLFRLSIIKNSDQNSAQCQTLKKKQAIKNKKKQRCVQNVIIFGDHKHTRECALLAIRTDLISFRKVHGKPKKI